MFECFELESFWSLSLDFCRILAVCWCIFFDFLEESVGLGPFSFIIRSLKDWFSSDVGSVRACSASKASNLGFSSPLGSDGHRNSHPGPSVVPPLNTQLGLALPRPCPASRVSNLR